MRTELRPPRRSPDANGDQLDADLVKNGLHFSVESDGQFLHIHARSGRKHHLQCI